jgi:signal transduction histidine kinase
MTPNSIPSSRELAALRIESRRKEITLQKSFKEKANGDLVHARALRQRADRLLADVVAAVQTGDPGDDPGGRPSADAEAVMLFDSIMEAVVESLPGQAFDEHEVATLVALAARRLARSMTDQLRASMTSYAESLLDALHEENLRERSRIARELHDHIGNGISAAYRQLELSEIYRETDAERSNDMVMRTRNDMKNILERLQMLLAGLRMTEAAKGLRSALRDYLRSANADDTQIMVNVEGDEVWLISEVCEEVFLIIREATRNALRHAGADTISISVRIAPNEVVATVEDDGVGFDPEQLTGSTSGLASMRERTELLGGMMKLDSAPRRGTRVELCVPLPGEIGD